MAELKSYSKSRADINFDKLQLQIIDSGFVNVFSGLGYSGDTLVILGDSIINEAELDLLIANHEVESLAALKEKRVNQIDAKTIQLISNGFVFDTKNFSLSLPAQSNWTNIKANMADFITLNAFPLEITSRQGVYMLSEANVFSFWATAMGTVKAHYGSGNDLKELITDAIDKAAVNAILDLR